MFIFFCPHFSPSFFFIPPFLKEIGRETGNDGKKGSRKEKRGMGSRRTGLSCARILRSASSRLHSLSLARQLFQFLPTEGRQVGKKQLVNCINSFWTPQYVWYPNPSLLTWQGEGVWCCLIGSSSCCSDTCPPIVLSSCTLLLFLWH